MDRRSSLDSIQQALFFSYLTGKKPAVVIYDTDSKLGRFEYQIIKACEKMDNIVLYIARISEDKISQFISCSYPLLEDGVWVEKSKGIECFGGK